MSGTIKYSFAQSQFIPDFKVAIMRAHTDRGAAVADTTMHLVTRGDGSRDAQ